MAALPPGTDFEDKEPQGPEAPPGFRFLVPEEPEFKDIAWQLAQHLFWFLVFALIFAYIATQCLESIQGVTGLTDVSFQQAFCVIVLLRIIGIATRGIGQ